MSNLILAGIGVGSILFLCAVIKITEVWKEVLADEKKIKRC